VDRVVILRTLEPDYNDSQNTAPPMRVYHSTASTDHDPQSFLRRGKTIGTTLGVLAAIPVAILSPPAGVLAGVGAVAFVLALTQAKRYWLMYGLYTFSLILLLASPGHVGVEAEERGVQILVGIGLLVIGLAIVHALGRWASKRDPQPELASQPTT